MGFQKNCLTANDFVSCWMRLGLGDSSFRWSYFLQFERIFHINCSYSSLINLGHSFDSKNPKDRASLKVFDTTDVLRYREKLFFPEKVFFFNII